MFIKRVNWEKRKETYTRLETKYNLLEKDYEKVLTNRLNDYNEVERLKGIVALTRIKVKEEPLLTKTDQDLAIKYYRYGWSFEEITERILAIRYDEIKRDMLKEVGVVISKRFDRQMYPVEFYGKVEEK